MPQGGQINVLLFATNQKYRLFTHPLFDCGV